MFQGSARNFPTPTITAEEYAIPLLRTDRWLEEAAEGELAVDVYEADERFVVQSTLAGVRPEDLSLSIQRDLLTVRGQRKACAPHDRPAYLTQECYWGAFSRSILLPEPVDVSRASATLTHGVLTIVLPKLIERTEIGIEEVDQ